MPTYTPTTVAPSRDYYVEGRNVLDAYGRLGGDMANLYGDMAGRFAQSDIDRYGGMQNQFSLQNIGNTMTAADQTALANMRLRAGNLGDVQAFAGGANQLRRDQNAQLFGGLDRYSNEAMSAVARDQAAVGLGGALSPQDTRNAQQSAREAWAARGLVNSPGAVGAEILNRDQYARQREAERRNYAQQSMANLYSANAAQSANAFDPFETILGGRYGMQTNNAGTNAQVFGQGASFASGQQGNQYVQNAFNPYNTYGADVFGSNFNADVARRISDANNAAAMAQGRDVSNASLANNFLNTLFTVGQTNKWWCWVAREVYGADNPRWLLFRHWLTSVGPRWFLRLYLRFGERFAAWLHRNPWLKPAVRRFMDGRIASLERRTTCNA